MVFTSVLRQFDQWPESPTLTKERRRVKSTTLSSQDRLGTLVNRLIYHPASDCNRPLSSSLCQFELLNDRQCELNLSFG
ncbi:hypothetical protein D9M69_730500 [compost metagenome]